MWKLVTELDMTTGVGQRAFQYREVVDGQIVAEYFLPEGAALLLMKDLIQGFPQIVEALIQEVNAEAAPQQPQPPMQQPLTPQMPAMPQHVPPPMSMQSEGPDTPLDLGGQRPVQGSTTTLADLAPRFSGERDAPQG